MISNLLSRADRPFELPPGTTGRSRHRGAGRAALRLAGIARGIATSRLGRIDRPLDGYAHVDVDDDALRAATGITLVPVDPDEVVDRFVPSPTATSAP
jgi:hypothetical protein